ncbi:O-acyltransferase [Aureococcus anophagefferens]|nr:O-acyltransferase [Aureococcus anophagefferens]
MRRLAAGALVALVAYRLRTSYLKERAKIVRIADVPEPAADLLRRLGWTAHVEEHLEARIRPSARAAGDAPKHPLVLVPGIISCGLELWRPGACYGRGWFRERLWGGLGMARAAVKNISCWLDHISLNATTGLDRDGHEVRAALGWSGAEYFAPGYWLWAKILANAAEVGYDRSTMHMACYDWRLSFRNLERRDGYLSRLKAEVEVLARQRAARRPSSWATPWARPWRSSSSPGARPATPAGSTRTSTRSCPSAGRSSAPSGPLGAILSGEMKATAMLGKVNELIDSQMSFLNKTQQRDIYRSLAASSPGDGDGTVPLASLGYPCYGLWRDAALAPIYNPSNVRTVVREYPHDACPIWQDPRGGTKTSRHVEIRNYDVIRDILDVATGHDDTSDRVTSDLPNVSANITAGLRRVLGAGGS